MYEFICEFAALEPSPPELQQLFWMVHGNRAAMDGFGEYRSDLLPRVFSQSTSEAVSN
jgi:hypothetical protein